MGDILTKTQVLNIPCDCINVEFVLELIYSMNMLQIYMGYRLCRYFIEETAKGLVSYTSTNNGFCYFRLVSVPNFSVTSVIILLPFRSLQSIILSENGWMSLLVEFL